VWEGPPASGTGVELAVPVRAGGSVLGVIEVRCERARERELDWVTALADVASLLALFLKRQHAEADLQRFARYDSLTGLPNRSFFLDTLERTLSRAGRQRTRSALVFLDLDGFKAVNDELGHATGDETLRGVGELLLKHSRGINVICRYGGDEFAVLLVETPKAGAQIYAGRIRHVLEHHIFPHGRRISASFGVATLPEDVGAAAEDLLRAADEALYAAKRAGRNCVSAHESVAATAGAASPALPEILGASDGPSAWLPHALPDAGPALEALVGARSTMRDEAGVVVLSGRADVRAARSTS